MNEIPLLPEPKRVLQLYDPIKQAAFQAWSAQDKLEWLEAINRLYWAAIRQNRAEH